MKCLTWYPEKRATAQELLDDPWLKMAKNYETKMEDEDYEEMMNKVKELEQKKKLAEALKGDKPEEKDSFSEYALSDEEVNGADLESVDSDESDRTLGHGDSDAETEDLFAAGYGKGKALNNSFTGPYSNMDHIHTDRGANPQFDHLL